MASNSNQPERPRAEPEIIPPDRDGPRGRGGGWPPYGTQRIYVSRIGPFGFALIMLVVGLLAVVMLLILIGTALIWIPLVAALVLIAFISRLFRR